MPQGQKIEQLFPAFAEANYFLEYSNSGELRTILGNNFVPYSDQPPLVTDQNSSISGPTASYKGQTIQKMAVGYVQIGKNFATSNQGRRLHIEMDISVFNSSTPPVVKIWTVNQIAPPVRATTILLAVQCTRDLLLTDHCTAETDISNFDDSQLQQVVIEIVNPQPSGSDLTWHYDARLVTPTPTPTNTAIPTTTPTPIPTNTPTFTPTLSAP